MKKCIVASLLLLFIICVIVACNEKEALDTQNPHENLNLHFSKPDGQSYIVNNKVEDRETVENVMEILQNISYENLLVSMSRSADYRIDIINTDPTISYEPVSYSIWISPNKNILEVIVEGQAKYGKTTKKDGKKLLAILENS